MKKLLFSILFASAICSCDQPKSKEVLRLEHIRDSIHADGLKIDSALKKAEKELGYDADSVIRKYSK